MPTLRIAGGSVLRPDFSVERADVLIDQTTGTIERIGLSLPGADETLEAAGCLVMPGLVNAHTHIAMTLLRGYADDKPVHAWLEEDIWPVEAALTDTDVRIGTELGALELIKSGTTAFCDMYFELPAIADAVEQSGLRARLGYGIVTVGKDEQATEAEIERGFEVAKRLDGTADGRIQSAFMPHALTTIDRDPIESILPEVRSAGLPVHFHANENPEFVDPIVETEDMRPLAYADEIGLLEAGDWLAHCVHMDDEEISLLADREVGAIHCPASNMKLASGAAPISKMREAGVTVGIGTDGAASNNDLDMFDEIRDAAMLGKLTTNDASAIPAAAALSMGTKEAATAIGLPGGELLEGGVADLAVVDFHAPNLQPTHDYVSHLAYAVTGPNVRHTICDGRVLMRNREVQTLDEEAVLDRAGKQAKSLVDRATT